MKLEEAIEKIDQETKKLGLKGALSEWADMVVEAATEDEAIRDGIEKHTLSELLGLTIKKSFETKTQVHDDIVKAAGLKPDKNRPIYIGIPTRAQVKKWIREVYTK